MTLNIEKEVHVLLVEDIAAHAELFLLTVELWGMPVKVDVIDNGQEALDMLGQIAIEQDDRPDIVMLDLSLPQVSGHELLAFIRSTPAIDDLPVIIMTSSSDESDVQRTSELGISGYLAKPVHVSQIRSVFERILS